MGEPTSKSRRGQGRLLASLLFAYLILALFFTWVLVPHDYEAEYLALGNLVVRGEVSLYQDEFTGQWTPLPFYFYGISQVVLGPSLFAGRLLSAALGAVVVALIFLLATRWGGPLAGATACALFCTHGLVMGYFAAVDFSGLVAALHLLGIYVLFGTNWPRRDLIGMAVFSVLFLVKPNYWPTIPFVLVFLLWRAGSHRARVAVTVAALAIPALFFLSDRTHLKMLAYVPILREWVEPLGYRPWHSLIEDVGHLGSEYYEVTWVTTLWGRLEEVVKAFAFFLKRYAVWVTAFVGLAALGIWRPRGRPSAADLWGPPGLRFTFWLYWYLLACQFIILGPLAKHAFAYMGAVAPLLATAIGCLFAAVWERVARPGPARGLVAAGMVLALAVSPWIHRQHNLPRRISLPDAPITALRKTAEGLAALIPAGETRVFSLADPLPIHLANRRTYLRQFHQHKFVFTSLRDPARYARSGIWGPSELEHWLGADARYAIVQASVLQFYRRRELYREILARMDSLLTQNFTLVETVPGGFGDGFLVYRRRGLATSETDRDRPGSLSAPYGNGAVARWSAFGATTPRSPSVGL